MQIELSKIRVDGGTQSRAILQRNIINEYAELMQSNVEMPPIDIFYDGKYYWLVNGFHRLYAKKQICANNDEGFLPEETIDAIIHQGTQRDAILFSLGANAEHGVRRNNEDKHRAVETMLRDNEWQSWSDREIARTCKVSNTYVSDLRKKLNDTTVNVDSKTYKRNGKVQTMKTENIGKHHVTKEKEIVNTETGEIIAKSEKTLAAQTELEKCPNIKEMFGDQPVEQSEPSYNVISEEGKILDLRTREGVIEILTESELRNTKEKLDKVEQELLQIKDEKGQLKYLMSIATHQVAKTIGLNQEILTWNSVLEKLKEKINTLTETNNQLFLANENLTKELNEIKQNNVDLEAKLKETTSQKDHEINRLIGANEYLREKVDEETEQSIRMSTYLIDIDVELESYLEAGIKKKEGIRINRTNSKKLLEKIKQGYSWNQTEQARGVE